MAKITRIMSRGVLTLKKDAAIEQTARLLAAKQCGCAVILDGNKPVGIVTESDIIRAYASGNSLKHPVSKIISSSIASMDSEMSIEQALKIADTKKFRRYPVIDNGKLAGIVTKTDIVHAASDNIMFHRNIQNAVIVLFVLFEAFVLFAAGYLKW